MVIFQVPNILAMFAQVPEPCTGPVCVGEMILGTSFEYFFLQY